MAQILWFFLLLHENIYCGYMSTYTPLFHHYDQRFLIVPVLYGENEGGPPSCWKFRMVGPAIIGVWQEGSCLSWIQCRRVRRRFPLFCLCLL